MASPNHTGGRSGDLHPIRRLATLKEVAALVCFLAGPNAGYMTGGVIDVAGGLGI